MNLFWERKAVGSYDAALKAATITSQNNMRATYHLTPTADTSNPWDTYTYTYIFRQWKHFDSNLSLSAVQEALKMGDNIKKMQHLFALHRLAQAKGAHQKSKNNVQGMPLYHPLLFLSPWQAPDDLDVASQSMSAPAILENMGHSQPPTTLFCDTECAIGMSDMTVTLQMSKSVDMRLHWVRDRITQGKASSASRTSLASSISPIFIRRPCLFVVTAPSQVFSFR
jgi:hypothetical protein